MDRSYETIGGMILRRTWKSGSLPFWIFALAFGGWLMTELDIGGNEVVRQLLVDCEGKGIPTTSSWPTTGYAIHPDAPGVMYPDRCYSVILDLENP